jgi:hypothetical protein
VQSVDLSNIGIILTDINNDRLKDILAQSYSPLLCGSSGCELHLFIQKSPGQYERISGPTNSYPRIGVSHKSGHTFADLIFKGKNDEDCIWQWGGKKYEFHKCM